MNLQLDASARAQLVLNEMTLEEKLSFLHGTGMPSTAPRVPQANGGAGFLPGVARLGIPAIQMADASYGVTHGQMNGRYATALPNTLAAASAWDTDLAFGYGALIGRELRDHGFNMSLGGGVNLTREPRNGRTFEYLGEDPLLAGRLVAAGIRGVQSQHVIGDIKHYALNDQESGRNALDAQLDERSMRESDLLPFEIGIEESDPGAVMCSYNRVNGVYACENRYLLTTLLRDTFHFKGFVLSDWGGTHSTALASAAGLDNEEPNARFFGDSLKTAVAGGQISMSELDTHVRRILYAMFKNGLVDHPLERDVVDVDAGLRIAQKTAEHSIVLLKNQNSILPLQDSAARHIAIIGAHADRAIISGGGSAQVDPPGGDPFRDLPRDPALPYFVKETWLPFSPQHALEQEMPQTTFAYQSGESLDDAAALARQSDLAIVFAYQWESESFDLKSLGLSEHQNELIACIAAANPHTIVVLETGGPVTMPWVGKVQGVVEAWYPGSRGVEALARILTGKVNPSAKLPITFPLSDADLPHPLVVQPPPESQQDLHPATDVTTLMARSTRVLAPFPVVYDEQLEVGYKWYDATRKEVLFPFGFGLSYTSFGYTGVSAELIAGKPTVKVTVRNTGKRDGEEIVEVYAALPAAAQEPPKRLVTWQKVFLRAGESKSLAMNIDRKQLSIFNAQTHQWQLLEGPYAFSVGSSSRNLPGTATLALGAETK